MSCQSHAEDIISAQSCLDEMGVHTHDESGSDQETILSIEDSGHYFRGLTVFIVFIRGSGRGYPVMALEWRYVEERGSLPPSESMRIFMLIEHTYIPFRCVKSCSMLVHDIYFQNE